MQRDDREQHTPRTGSPVNGWEGHGSPNGRNNGASSEWKPTKADADLLEEDEDQAKAGSGANDELVTDLYKQLELHVQTLFAWNPIQPKNPRNPSCNKQSTPRKRATSKPSSHRNSRRNSVQGSRHGSDSPLRLGSRNGPQSGGRKRGPSRHTAPVQPVLANVDEEEKEAEAKRGKGEDSGPATAIPGGSGVHAALALAKQKKGQAVDQNPSEASKAHGMDANLVHNTGTDDELDAMPALTAVPLEIDMAPATPQPPLRLPDEAKEMEVDEPKIRPPQACNRAAPVAELLPQPAELENTQPQLPQVENAPLVEKRARAKKSSQERKRQQPRGSKIRQTVGVWRPS